MGVRFVVRSRRGQPVPGDIELVFDQSRVVIGRGAAADVRLPDGTISDTHATVLLRDDAWWLVDAGSTNGTKLNGQRLSGDRGRKLRDADSLELGAYQLSFHLQPLVIEPMSAERTAELARRLLRQTPAPNGPRIASPRLCVLSGAGSGSSFEIPASPSRSLIGQAESCQLVLADPELAREHAEVVHDLDGILIKSLGAGHAVVHGGQAVQSRRLRDGDELVLGSTRLLFEDPAQASLDALACEPDVPYTPPAPAPVPEKTEPLAPAASVAPSRPAPDKPARADADVMIYLLAGTVLAVSVAALVMLLRAY